MQRNDHLDFLNLARELACEAGNIILEHWGRAEARRKADGSPVTDADVEAEEHIVRRIDQIYPDHAVLGEEGAAHGRESAGSRYCWIVDPLDGTRNFARGFPCVATSIALTVDGEPVVGVVRTHLTNRTYWAAASEGAFLDGDPIRVAQRPFGRNFFVGVPSIKEDESPAPVVKFMERVNVRNIGSTAAHLALVASGAIDGIYALRCHAWDIAAGMLLVREAGGVCTTPSSENLLPLPRPDDPSGLTPILAAGTHAHADLVELVRPVL